MKSDSEIIKDMLLLHKKLYERLFEAEILERYEGSELDEIFDGMDKSDEFYLLLKKYLK